MHDLPDAPYIVDAETNGVGYNEGDEYYCPFCNAPAPDYIYTVSNGNVIGCSECVQQWDGWEAAEKFLPTREER